MLYAISGVDLWTGSLAHTGIPADVDTNFCMLIIWIKFLYFYLPLCCGNCRIDDWYKLMFSNIYGVIVGCWLVHSSRFEKMPSFIYTSMTLTLLLLLENTILWVILDSFKRKIGFWETICY